MRHLHTIAKSIDIDFAHHVSGHTGACINLHGHTWKFEIGLEATDLSNGFVIDFGVLKHDVLTPIHVLLDHSTALGEKVVNEARPHIEGLGRVLLMTRPKMTGAILGLVCDVAMEHYVRADELGYQFVPYPMEVGGARNEIIGGLKIAVFPFVPTSERLAEWAFRFAVSKVEDDRVKVAYARVFETLHPVKAFATFSK